MGSVADDVLRDLFHGLAVGEGSFFHEDDRVIDGAIRLGGDDPCGLVERDAEPTVVQRSTVPARLDASRPRSREQGTRRTGGFSLPPMDYPRT